MKSTSPEADPACTDANVLRRARIALAAVCEPGEAGLADAIDSRGTNSDGGGATRWWSSAPEDPTSRRFAAPPGGIRSGRAHRSRSRHRSACCCAG